MSAGRLAFDKCVVLAVNGYPFLGDHARGEPEPETENAWPQDADRAPVGLLRCRKTVTDTMVTSEGDVTSSTCHHSSYEAAGQIMKDLSI